MSTSKLEVAERSDSGSNAMRKLRADGKVPGVLYGLGRDPRAIAVEGARMDAFLREGARLAELSLGGKTQPAFLKDLQFDPLSDRVLHADFMRVDLDEKLQLSVPVKFTGVAKGQSAGGIVEQLAVELEVECLPDKIPEEISVSITELDVGQVLHAKDLEMPDGVKPADPEAAVVGCVVPTAEAEADEEGAEGGEGAEPEVVTKKDKPDGE